ncbi:hypothetical protein [Salinicoccus luteus]|uniref:hypothetical protein n=1 Tax=Salinicoccus luteus TaxID=367840 RepID=UPI000B0C0B8A|nr:hypothetical protein [Salinicoccus luteus]
MSKEICISNAKDREAFEMPFLFENHTADDTPHNNAGVFIMQKTKKAFIYMNNYVIICIIIKKRNDEVAEETI